MRSSYFFIPFLAVLVVALGVAVSVAYADLAWVNAAGWACGLALLVLWVALDLKGFKEILQRKGAKYGASSGVSIILGILVIIGIGALSNRPRFNKSFDATRAGLNTLSEQSVKIIKNLEDKDKSVELTAFFKDEEVKQKFKDLIALYTHEGDVLNITYIDPQTDPLKARARNISTANTVIFNHGEQEARITTFSEEKVTNALVKVLKEGTKKIYFSQGHGEPSLESSEAEGYSQIVKELESNRYEVAALNFFESGKVPDDATMVVIAGPKYDLKAEELRLVQEYLDKGGALLVMVDAMVQADQLNGFTSDYGVEFNNDFLILRPNDFRAQLIGQNNAVVSDFDEFHSVTKDYAAKGNIALLMPNTRSLVTNESNQNSMKVEVVGKTSDIMIRVKNVRSQKDLGQISDDRIEAGSFDVIAVATGKSSGDELASKGADDTQEKKDVSEKKIENAAKDVRIVVVGSSQFATNLGTQRPENRDLFLNITSFLSQDEDFISIRPKPKDSSTIEVSSSTSRLSLFFFAIIYPFLFLGGGGIYWLKRRRQ